MGKELWVGTSLLTVEGAVAQGWMVCTECLATIWRALVAFVQALVHAVTQHSVLKDLLSDRKAEWARWAGSVRRATRANPAELRGSVWSALVLVWEEKC